MPERATVAQVVHVKPETVSGTPETTGFHRLQTVGFSLTPQLETRTVRPDGNKYPSIATIGKDWSQLAVSGEPSYEDVQPLLLSVIGNVTDATKNHKYVLNVSTADTVKTLTVERGETSVRWEQVAGVQINELQFQFTRDAVQLSGSALGKAFTTATAAWGTEAALGQLHPILPADVCVYWDPTYATLGTTKLTRVLSAQWQVANRFNPLWVLDCAADSYVALVEATPTITANLTLEADTAAMAFVTAARAGTKGFLEIEADGGTQDGSAMKLTIDTSMTVESVGELADQDGVYAIQVNLTGAVGAWAASAPGVCEISLDNSLSGAYT